MGMKEGTGKGRTIGKSVKLPPSLTMWGVWGGSAGTTKGAKKKEDESKATCIMRVFPRGKAIKRGRKKGGGDVRRWSKITAWRPAGVSSDFLKRGTDKPRKKRGTQGMY